MRRREFLVGIALAPWLSFTASAQPAERVRRIAVLMLQAENDPESKPRVAALTRGLEEAHWIPGRNLEIEVRWGASDPTRSRAHAAEVVELSPDVILTTASAATAAVQEATRSLPIVFVNVTDPVGAGYVASLARPGGNLTGFTTFEYGMSGKWLELLREIAPGVSRVAVLRDPSLPVGIGQFGALQSAAPSLKMEVTPLDVRNPKDIEHGIEEFARFPKSGLIVAASPGALINRTLIISTVMRCKVPAVYFQKEFVREGGLASYGPDVIAQYHNAAAYVDRILKGENPADLPVQAPNRYELALNLKAAKALGLDLPAPLLARADEVIE